MVDYGVRLGDSRSLHVVKEWLTSWRAGGSTNPQMRYGEVDTRELADTAGRRALPPDADVELVALYARCEGLKAAGFFYLVLLRQHHANFSAQYTKLQTKTKSRDKTKAASVGKQQMFQWLTPDLRTEEELQAQWCSFGRFIKISKRWEAFRDRLGIGMVGLIPSSIPKTYIEATLTVAQLDIWLQMIEECFPQTCQLAARLTQWMEVAAQGKPPPGEQSRLERARPVAELNAAQYGAEWLDPEPCVVNSQAYPDIFANFFAEDFPDVEFSSPFGMAERDRANAFMTGTQDLNLMGDIDPFTQYFDH